jgi:hypothetical protein
MSLSLPIPNIKAAWGATWTHVKVYANYRLRPVFSAPDREGDTGVGSGRGELEMVLG